MKIDLARLLLIDSAIAVGGGLMAWSVFRSRAVRRLIARFSLYSLFAAPFFVAAWFGISVLLARSNTVTEIELTDFSVRTFESQLDHDWTTRFDVGIHNGSSQTVATDLVVRVSFYDRNGCLEAFTYIEPVMEKLLPGRGMKNLYNKEGRLMPEGSSYKAEIVEAHYVK